MNIHIDERTVQIPIGKNTAPLNRFFQFKFTQSVFPRTIHRFRVKKIVPPSLVRHFQAHAHTDTLPHPTRFHYFLPHQSRNIPVWSEKNTRKYKNVHQTIIWWQKKLKRYRGKNEAAVKKKLSSGTQLMDSDQKKNHLAWFTFKYWPVVGLHRTRRELLGFCDKSLLWDLENRSVITVMNQGGKEEKDRRTKNKDQWPKKKEPASIFF